MEFSRHLRGLWAETTVLGFLTLAKQICCRWFIKDGEMVTGFAIVASTTILLVQSAKSVMSYATSTWNKAIGI